MTHTQHHETHAPKQQICIVGLGYMGFPTALLLARGGCTVVGLDVDAAKVAKIQRGELPFVEEGLDALYAAGRDRFSATCALTKEQADHIDTYIISVPTPHTSDHKCDLSYVIAATKSVAKTLRRGGLVILESTVRPGTTVDVVKPLLEQATGLRAGIDFSLAYVSEKAIPGNTLYEMVHNDRIIGAFDTNSAERTRALYTRFVTGALVLTDCTSAETAKLVENTYRDVNIALANELADICSALKINVWEVIALANRHPRVHVHTPGPGVGGHCIAIDPWFLTENHPAPLVTEARNRNDSRPAHVVAAITRLASARGLTSHAPVTLLGAAYKPDVDDSRESPTITIAALLKDAGHTVTIHDPFVTHFEYPIEHDLTAALARSDIIVVVTDHNPYRQLAREQPQLFANKLVIDTRNIGLPGAILIGKDF